MPFLAKPFVTKLQERLDKDAANFIGPVEGDLTVDGYPTPPYKWATVWSEATALGAAGIAPPNTLIQAGQAAMFSVLITNNSGTPKHAILKQGFVAFATTLTPGFLPLAHGIPPPVGPAFETLDALGMASQTVTPWLQACGTLVQTWFLQQQLIYTAGPTPGTWL